jgi:hypothetical protein
MTAIPSKPTPAPRSPSALRHEFPGFRSCSSPTCYTKRYVGDFILTIQIGWMKQIIAVGILIDLTPIRGYSYHGILLGNSLGGSGLGMIMYGRWKYQEIGE